MARILLVDEPDILMSCAEALTASGHECQCASCCRAAVRSLMEDRPDLVVLNPHLGGCDGVRTLEAIREFDPNICVVLHAAASLFGNTYEYFLADRTIVRQIDCSRLLQYVESKFGSGVVGPDSQAPKYHVGVF